MELILASASPRRQALLRQCGFDFTVETARVAELTDAGDLYDLPRENAARKAEAVARRHPDSLIVGADTMIVFSGRAIGKPADAADAVRMLEEFSGRTHDVVTGVALRCVGRGMRESWRETSHVTFRELTPDVIREYLRRVRVLDKAGAYAIQECGEMIVAGFSGELENIVGLPLRRLTVRLRELLRA